VAWNPVGPEGCAYDDNTNLRLSITDPLNRVTRFTYDAKATC
jgi:hypothetical protein